MIYLSDDDKAVLYNTLKMHASCVSEYTSLFAGKYY